MANADWVINSKHTLSMRYFFTQIRRPFPSASAACPGTPIYNDYSNTNSRS